MIIIIINTVITYILSKPNVSVNRCSIPFALNNKIRFNGKSIMYILVIASSDAKQSHFYIKNTIYAISYRIKLYIAILI